MWEQTDVGIYRCNLQTCPDNLEKVPDGISFLRLFWNPQTLNQGFSASNTGTFLLHHQKVIPHFVEPSIYACEYLLVQNIGKQEYATIT